MNRFQVIEAFPDGDTSLRMQALNIHPSYTAAYWYYAPQIKGELATNRLYVIDLKRQTILNWTQCETMMLLEGLHYLQKDKTLHASHMIALNSNGLINNSGEITSKGDEFLSEHSRNAQEVTLPFVKSSSITRLG